jgi:hypothetical protein
MRAFFGFLFLASVDSQLAPRDDSCAVNRANGEESDMWSVKRSRLVPIHWLRVTKAYEDRIERTPHSPVKLHTIDDPGRSVEPDWGFSMVVHGKAYGGSRDDVVSSNIILHNAPYCDPDMVNLSYSEGIYLGVAWVTTCCSLTLDVESHHHLPAPTYYQALLLAFKVG